MALCINQSGTWRNITTLCVNQSGTWRNITTGCINESSTWRKFGFSAPLPVPLGCAYLGGYFVCQAAGVRWIVAPATSEVNRNWYNRNDAVTQAQACTGCTDWFIPTKPQLKNPGYTCRAYWDSYSTTPYYWSSTEWYPRAACGVCFLTGSYMGQDKTYHTGGQLRAFRCVSY